MRRTRPRGSSSSCRQLRSRCEMSSLPTTRIHSTRSSSAAARPGSPSGITSPSGGDSVRHPRCERAHRRCVAEALGLAAAVHARALRRAAGMPFPGSPRRVHLRRTRWRTTSRRTPARFELPVRTGVRVDRLSKRGDRFVVRRATRRSRLTTSWSRWRTTSTRSVPAFAKELDPRIVQLHSSRIPEPVAAS